MLRVVLDTNTLLRGLVSRSSPAAQVRRAAEARLFVTLLSKPVLDEYRATCDCRKPQAGLLRQAAQDWQIDLSGSFMIGDGVTDIAAGCAVKATTLFVNSRKCYHCDSLAAHHAWPDYLVSDLQEAALVIRRLETGDRDAAQQFALKCLAP